MIRGHFYYKISGFLSKRGQRFKVKLVKLNILCKNRGFGFWGPSIEKTKNGKSGFEL